MGGAVMFGFRLDPLRKIKKGHTWRFHGGIHPNENKYTSDLPLTQMPLPNIFVVPIKQHSGNAGEIIVREGQSVKKGDPLTMCLGGRELPVHAPTSGTVKEIRHYTSCHPSGFKEMTVIIEPDGKDEWTTLNKVEDFTTLTEKEIIAKIRDAGIVGMGGAGFPAHAKITSALGKTKILIINGCECEPYLTCDDRLMQERSGEIVTGIQILQHVLKPEVVIVAIENNKPAAIAAMKKAINSKQGIQIRVLPTLYPSGAARPLIRILTGHEVGYTHRSTDFGVMMQNVTSTYYIKRAVVDGEPLIERPVTITGNNFKKHGNVIIRNGTLVRQIVNSYQLVNTQNVRLIVGGPMMGFNIGSLSVPLTKTVNCIIAPDEYELPSQNEPLNCIKCGKCQNACPSRLTPYKMYGHVKSGNFDLFEKCNPKDCIECGCCSYVCPSKIDLVGFFRIGKAELRKKSAESRRREQIKADTNFKLEMIKFEQETRAARLEQLKKTSSTADGEVSAAKLKVQEAIKRAQQERNQQNDSSTPAAQSAREKALALAKARAQAQKDGKEQHNQAEVKTEPAADSAQTVKQDPKEIARQKALALAKARAQAQKDGNEQQTKADVKTVPAADSVQNVKQDPKEIARQKALALAKARAQAQKDGKEQQNQAEVKTEPAADSAQNVKQDPKEIARQKALALAKARAQAQKDSREQQNQAEVKTEASAESAQSVKQDPKEIARKKALALARQRQLDKEKDKK